MTKPSADRFLIQPKPIKKYKHPKVKQYVDDWRRRPVYIPGDGDIIIFKRPGSDHSHLKSFGTLT